jgi:exosortase A-associated hydrolase 2
LSDTALAARFIERAGQRILLVTWRPPAQQGSAVLIAPPFAEEMNKSRRMLAEVGRALALRGMAAVLPDLGGTGDSSGEFRDAGWESWREDLLAAAAWSASEGWPVVALLAVRSGCILGAQAASGLPAGLARTVFWQPVADGERFLTQFLRLRVAAAAVAGGRESVALLRQQLSAGQSLEVAGYELSPRLAGELAGLRLAAHLTPALGALHWLEVGREPGAPLPEASQSVIAAARSAGVSVTARSVAGEPFWSSTEIVQIPELLQLTVQTLAAAP